MHFIIIIIIIIIQLSPIYILGYISLSVLAYALYRRENPQPSLKCYT